MRSYFDRWVRQLIRRGVRSGLIEGSNLWLSIGAVAWLVRLLTRRPAPVVSVERLRLGESVVVSHVPAPPASRRARKKAAKKAVKAAWRQETARSEQDGGRRARREQRAARAAAARGGDDPEGDTGAPL